MNRLNASMELVNEAEAITEARRTKPKFYPSEVAPKIEQTVRGMVKVLDWKKKSGGEPGIWTDMILEVDPSRSNGSVEIDEIARKIRGVVAPLIGDNPYHYNKDWNFGQMRYEWQTKWGKQSFGVWMPCYRDEYGPGRHKLHIQLVGPNPPKGKKK
jgi:hypothetical protein